MEEQQVNCFLCHALPFPLSWTETSETIHCMERSDFLKYLPKQGEVISQAWIVHDILQD
jgi:hypothetical protein